MLGVSGKPRPTRARQTRGHAVTKRTVCCPISTAATETVRVDGAGCRVIQGGANAGTGTGEVPTVSRHGLLTNLL